MKKIVFLVLVLVFGFNTLFAEAKMFKEGDYIYMVDDEEQQKDFSKLDDLTIISIIAYHAPKTFGDKELLLYKSNIFNESLWITDEYYNVWVLNKDETMLVILENLGDGRYAEIVFMMKDK